MKRSILITVALLATIALTVLASTNPNGTPEWSIERAASKVTIDKSGGIHLDPRVGQNVTIEAGDSVAYSATNYSGTSSFQPIGVDLNLAGAAGGTTGKFLSPIMGNVIGANLSKSGNYVGGLIGYYSITGTNASTYPKAGVIGGVADGSTTADCAVCAVIDGDSAQVRANSAFGVDHLNSTPGSGFSFGLDLYKAAHDGYNAANYSKADVRMSNEVCILNGAGVPTNGVTGATVAGPGSLYIDTTNKKLYINTNTKASPTWTVVGTQS